MNLFESRQATKVWTQMNVQSSQKHPHTQNTNNRNQLSQFQVTASSWRISSLVYLYTTGKKGKGMYAPSLSLRQTLSFLSVKTSRVAHCPQKIYNQAWEPCVTLKNKEAPVHICHSGNTHRLLSEPQPLRFAHSPDHQRKCTKRLWAITHHRRKQITHMAHRACNCSRRVWPGTVRKENTVNKPDPGQKGLEFSFSWWIHVGLSPCWPHSSSKCSGWIVLTDGEIYAFHLHKFLVYLNIYILYVYHTCFCML